MTAMGKEASLEGLEFDGDTVLCRVCGDKASGFHYGVHACEGCKGFFRRSIQQKIQYRPCLKNQQCNIMRVNRNRCQYCRLKKCVAVGMSKDAVRFGRVPKKEKARIIEQMQKSSMHSQTNQMLTMIQNSQDLIQAIVAAHQQTCMLTLDHVRHMKEEALHNKDFVDCPAHMACPLNSHFSSKDEESHGWMDMSEFITPAIKSVVNFARLIPGFSHLSQDDQVTLLKAATFEVLLVRFACLFDPETNTMMFTNGKIFKRPPSQVSTNAGFLLDSMFEFAERFNALNLSEEEIALFSAIVLLSPDRPGLRNTEHLENFQMKLTECLQTVTSANHEEDNTLFAKLLMKTTDLRTLNTLHSEKSIGNNEKLRGQDSGNMDHHEGQFDSAVSDTSTASEVSSRAGSSLGATGYDSGIYEGNGIPVIPQRQSLDLGTHPQVILKTPYGTFCREDSMGFYGLIPDQPIRRCHTLERDILSRPRLHTIEEKRRYTLDKDSVDKNMRRLFDRHMLRGNSMPSSLAGSRTGSAASSPIPPELLAYQNRSSHEFTPISITEALSASARGSPMLNQDSHLSLPSASSKPGSPNPRSRSGSMGANDLEQMRPRCYSFHMNSEGRAARYPMQAEGQHLEHLDNMYMSPEMRRGSVGASYGLYHRKKSLLVDRHPRYLSRLSDGMKRVDKPKPAETVTGPSKGDSLSSFCISVPSMSKSLHWSQQDRDPSEESIKATEMESKENAMETEPVALTMESINESDKLSEKSSDTSESPVVESMFHKKFDKMRKHPRSAEEEASRKSSCESQPSVITNEFDESDCNMNVDDVPNHDLAKLKINDEVCMETEKPKKKSAVESHPQLLAQLNSPSKNTFQPGFLKLPLKMSPPSPGVSSPSQQPQVMLNVPKVSGRTSSVAKDLPTLASHLNSAPIAHPFRGNLGEASALDSHDKEPVKNSILVNLKDRLSRKFENSDMPSSRGADNSGLHHVEHESESHRGKVPEAFHVNTMNSAGPEFAFGKIPESQRIIAPGMFQQGTFPMHPAFLGSQPYQSMFMTPGYNQHLAGMQQLAQIYAKNNEQHRKNSSENQVLNLTAADKPGDSEMGMNQETKEVRH